MDLMAAVTVADKGVLVVVKSSAIRYRDVLIYSH